MRSFIILGVCLALACLFTATDGQTLKPIARNVADLRRILLYPYPKEHLTEVKDLNPYAQFTFNFFVPFFGTRFSYTWVTLFGSLHFGLGDDSSRYPLKFPSAEWPEKRDAAFIGPFYAKAQIGNGNNAAAENERPPGVYFKSYQNIHVSQRQEEIDLQDAIRLDIQAGIIGAGDFRPKHVILVTWRNVTFGGSANRSKTNTYQAMLATDDDRTYAIFNYERIVWSSSTEANGGAQDGRGGTPAFVGFNAGNGTRAFEYKPYSQTNKILQLATHGGINAHPGRHIFRIDEDVQQGSCSSELVSSLLTLSPDRGHLLGGTMVNISGPCFESDQPTWLTIHGITIKCAYESERVAVCAMPPLYTAGWANVTVQIGEYFDEWESKFYVENPMLGSELVSFEKPSTLHSLDVKEFNLFWNKSSFDPWPIGSVRISLWGYSETGRTPQAVYIKHLTDDPNIGRIVIDMRKFSNNDDGWKKNMTVGFIQVNATHHSKDGMSLTNVLWSRPIPLGWYFVGQWKAKYGPNWSQAKCEEWVKEDNRRPPLSASSLPVCPCTLQQAQFEKGRFMPDSQCDQFGEWDCYGNGKLKHCVVSAQPDSTGHGQHCCYDHEDMLVTPTDTQQASSFPARAHPFGQHPFNVSGKVPGLSYWYQDLTGYFTCCDWSKGDDTCYLQFMKLRPTNDCTGYRSSNSSQVYGDPHFITNDKSEFIFNGQGEFSLVNVHNREHHFDVQARFEQYVNITRATKLPATILTAIVAKGNNTSTVEVQHQRSGQEQRHRLRVIVDQKTINLEKHGQKYQTFKGVTVYTPAPIRNQSIVVVAFGSGAGLEVFNYNENIAARIYLPPSFMNQTRGLLGNWTNNRTDDFASPDGHVLATPSIRTIHTEFGLKWVVSGLESWGQGSRSLFYHEYGRSSSFYNRPDFRPILEERPPIDPSSRLTERDVQRLCGRNKACSYDYIVTENSRFAGTTRRFRDELYQQEIRAHVVGLCPALSPSPHMRMSTSSRLIGARVLFECPKGFVLHGNPDVLCLPQLRWSPQPDASCKPE